MVDALGETFDLIGDDFVRARKCVEEADKVYCCYCRYEGGKWLLMLDSGRRLWASWYKNPIACLHVLVSANGKLEQTCDMALR